MLDTTEDPWNNHTSGDQGGSWTTPLKNCLGAMFERGLIRQTVFWEIKHDKYFHKNGMKKTQMQQLKERKGYKEQVNMLISKKNWTQEKNPGAIEDQGGSWTTP